MNTEHLTITPCTISHLETLLEGDATVQTAFGLKISPGYLEFPGAVEYSLRLLESGVSEDEWSSPCMIIHTHDNTLIGLGGYKGTANEEGIVEIDYSIAPAYRGRGYATELVNVLIEHAFTKSDISAVWAHTVPEINASNRVLIKCGLEKIAEVIDPEEGEIWRWEIRKDGK